MEEKEAIVLELKRNFKRLKDFSLLHETYYFGVLEVLLFRLWHHVIQL